MTREDFGQLLKDRGLLGPAVEVGVYRGAYAACILSWGVEKLYLVDAWKHVDGGLAELIETQEALEAAHEECLDRLSGDLDRVMVLRGWSIDMAKYIPNGSCDFVYIDASHAYASVKSDLRNYWAKLQPDGIMAGHDYHIPGVRQAVDEFAEGRGLQVNQAPVNEGDISFWLDWEVS